MGFSRGSEVWGNRSRTGVRHWLKERALGDRSVPRTRNTAAKIEGVGNPYPDRAAILALWHQLCELGQVAHCLWALARWGMATGLQGKLCVRFCTWSSKPTTWPGTWMASKEGSQDRGPCSQRGEGSSDGCGEASHYPQSLWRRCRMRWGIWE